MPPLPPSSATKPSTKANSVENPTMPPLYVCYILRSKAKNVFSNRSYVGSTPDPPKRFRQHNGAIKGGAWRTSLNGPWEMEAFVYGFPNKLSALQFEWAWDHAEKTHWLVAAAPVSDTPPPAKPKPAKKGKGKGKAQLTLTSSSGTDEPPLPSSTQTKGKAKPVDVIRLFPKEIGSNRLLQRFAAMQRLLTVPPFSAYKLGVYLFSPNAEKLWEDALAGRYLGGWADKITGRLAIDSKRRLASEVAKVMGPPDLGRVRVVVKYEGIDGKRPERERGVPYGSETEAGEQSVLLQASDLEFAKRQWEKFEAIDAESSHRCECCQQAIDVKDHLNIALCPTETCTSLSHLTCLASHFLASEPPSASTFTATLERLMPVHGKCPSCGSALHWQDVVRSSWRRHDHSTTPIKATRKSKKALAALEESDNSDDDLFLDAETAALVEKDEDAGERVMVEEAEKEASFDAGYLWQPDEAGEDERESEPEGAPKKRSSSPTSSDGSSKRKGRPSKSRSTAPDPVEPKRRGRPPKSRTPSPAEDSRTPDLLNSNEEGPQPIERPVGRPRKSIIDLSSDPSPPSSPAKRKARTPSPPHSPVDVSSPPKDVPPASPPSPSPKKRSKTFDEDDQPEGAPKKRSSSSASSEGSAKRRGRPPKARSITPEPVEPKRRGRPPKPRTRSPAEDVPSPDQEAPQPFKRPVGRPRKSMIDLSSDPSPLSAPGKRKVRAPTPPPARVDTSSPLPDILSTVSPSLSPKKRSKPLNGTVPLSTPTEIGKRFSAIELSSSPIPASKPKAGAKAKAKKKETQVVIEISD